MIIKENFKDYMISLAENSNISGKCLKLYLKDFDKKNLKDFEKKLEKKCSDESFWHSATP